MNISEIKGTQIGFEVLCQLKEEKAYASCGKSVSVKTTPGIVHGNDRPQNLVTASRVGGCVLGGWVGVKTGEGISWRLEGDPTLDTLTSLRGVKPPTLSTFRKPVLKCTMLTVLSPLKIVRQITYIILYNLYAWATRQDEP